MSVAVREEPLNFSDFSPPLRSAFVWQVAVRRALLRFPFPSHGVHTLGPRGIPSCLPRNYTELLFSLWVYVLFAPLRCEKKELSV